ncbi:MAG: copper ion binding protein [Xylanivirga thermophila]|uniref:heavy-metal-associated domain-containing protein n=1 Tax=Xylanivirga thermophila TaxID=2496273 RepID=UPI00101C3652|nr:copper ion binding protein [Xylanivirga thermophila]
MKKKIFIDGMSCQHCVNRVTVALNNMEGVSSAKVNLDGGFAEVELDKDISDDAFREIIDDAGYDVIKIENE